jgi:hypothetical protein
VIDSQAWTGDWEADTQMDLDAQQRRQAALARWLDAHPGLGGLVILATALICFAGIVVIWRRVAPSKSTNPKQGWCAIEKAYATPQPPATHTPQSRDGRNTQNRG